MATRGIWEVLIGAWTKILDSEVNYIVQKQVIDWQYRGLGVPPTSPKETHDDKVQCSHGYIIYPPISYA